MHGQSTDYINYNVYIKHGHKFKHGLDDLYKDDSLLLATTLSNTVSPFVTMTSQWKECFGWIS
jgi:hypothetical protein